jgi:hypothetical protein
MKRKDYEKPTMQVVKLQLQPQLLAGSDPSANLPGMEQPEEI